MLSEKRYVHICVGIVLLVLVGIASFNYWQDPADIFPRESRYKEIAKESCDGKIIALTGNYDERLFRKSVITNGNNDYRIVVLGSSRVMTIGEESIADGTSLINLGVSGGVIQDYIALWYRYQLAMKSKPDMVIIGVDPWIFNKNNGEIRWQKSLGDDYVDAMNSFGFSRKITRNVEDYKQLLSIKYFRESRRKWRKRIKGLEVWGGEGKSDESTSLLYPDGSIEYAHSLYMGNAEDKARDFIRGEVYHLEDYDELDPVLKEEFADFIESIKKQGIKVMFYLPPYHPIVYDFLSCADKYKCMIKANDWLRDFARDNGIEAVGAYNPVEIGLNNESFFDGMHLKRYKLNEYLKTAFR